MKFERFEDILGWQKARDLATKIYNLRCKVEYGIDAGFKDQIQRAIVSVMSNIAEGFEYRNDKQFRNYLKIAKGSAAEVRSLIYLGEDLGYIDKAENLSEKIIEVSKILAGLIKSLTD